MPLPVMVDWNGTKLPPEGGGGKDPVPPWEGAESEPTLMLIQLQPALTRISAPPSTASAILRFRCVTVAFIFMFVDRYVSSLLGSHQGIGKAERSSLVLAQANWKKNSIRESIVA